MTAVLSILSLSAAMTGGVFLTFSEFVMPSLRDTPGSGGPAAMQEINRQVYRTLFMVMLVGLAPVTLALAVWGWHSMSPSAPLLLGAAAAWLILVIGVSAIGNIPMNKHLATLRADGAAARAYWPRYVRTWSLWNHLRVVGCMAAAGCLGQAALLSFHG